MASKRLTYQDWIVEIGRDPSQPVSPGCFAGAAGSRSREAEEEKDQRLELIREQVQKALAALSEPEQQFLTDFYFSGCSYESIAARQGRAVYKLESLHRRALRKLRRSLAGLMAREYGVLTEPEHSCPICSSPDRREIDQVIHSRNRKQTWGPVMKRLREEFGLKLRSPQTIIGHLKYH
jgi:hypothetical protein